MGLIYRHTKSVSSTLLWLVLDLWIGALSIHSYPKDLFIKVNDLFLFILRQKIFYQITYTRVLTVLLVFKKWHVNSIRYCINSFIIKSFMVWGSIVGDLLIANGIEFNPGPNSRGSTKTNLTIRS